jgi:hypothetical protein
MKAAGFRELFGFGGSPLTRSEKLWRIGLFCLWLAIVLTLIARHVMWRDEVRAFSLAMQGDSVWQMLVQLRGEGHPALWYLMLRSAHALFPTPHVLQAMAAMVGIGAMALLIWRSPFRPIVIALILASGFGLYTFVVMARNYGITMLILFAIAAAYRRYRDRGFVLALLVFLLCNSNAHSLILAGGFLIFWFFDLVSEHGFWGALRRPAFLAGGIALIAGAGACYWEVSLPLQDAVMTPQQAADNQGFLPLLRDLLLPGIPFAPLGWGGLWSALLLSLLFWLALAGLSGRPGTFLAGLAVQSGMILLFHAVYPGAYRHAALFLVFLIFLYWLAADGHGGRWQIRRPNEAMGCAAMLILLAMQMPMGIAQAKRLIRGEPESSSAALGALIKRSGLEKAIVLGDPDYHLEALPYYAPNPTYFVRENRFGRVVQFSSKAQLHLELNDILARAVQLRARYRRPVIVTLEDRIDPDQPATIRGKGYVWTFRTDPAQVRAFLHETCRLARFDNASTDETYDVYLLPLGGVSAGPAACGSGSKAASRG